MKELTLEEIKQSELQSLIAIDEFCSKHNIRYWLAYGTLLGAVRHKGFIPWDDDIDVCMPRKDYDFFIENFNGECDCRKAISIKNTKGYYLNAAKVIDTRTILIENVYKPIEIGCFVDVFPMDYLPDDDKETRSFLKTIKNRYKTINLISAPLRKSWPIYKKTIWLLFRLVKPFFSRKKEIKRISNLAKKYEDKYSNYWALLEHDSLGYVGKIDASYWNETIMLEFEGHPFRAPREYDKVLSSIYGDYLVLPPKEKQITHHNFKCWWRDSN